MGILVLRVGIPHNLATNKEGKKKRPQTLGDDFSILLPWDPVRHAFIVEIRFELSFVKL